MRDAGYRMLERLLQNPCLNDRSADIIVRQSCTATSYTGGQECPRSGGDVLQESLDAGHWVLDAGCRMPL